MSTNRDRLYLLNSEFGDAALPNRRFYCRECMLVEGLLSAFPERAEGLEIIRADYPRPRPDVVAAVGEINQGLPLLVLADASRPGVEAREHEGVRFVSEIGALLNALHVRHGFPEPHP